MVFDKGSLDYSLYLVTDRAHMSSPSLEEGVAAALAGGCTIVQLREKDASSLDFYNMALRIKKITDSYNVPLIINDRVDIALAVDAAGVHLGRSDMPVAVARRLLGESRIIGASAASPALAAEAASHGADYIGAGAVFATGTKADARPLAHATLAEVIQAAGIPVVAIGGISHSNAPLLGGIPIAGIAAASAILGAADIEAAARDLRTIFAQGRPGAVPAHSAGRGSNGSHVHNSGSEAGGGERAHSAGRGSSDGHALSAKREAGGGHGLGDGAGRGSSGGHALSAKREAGGGHGLGDGAGRGSNGGHARSAKREAGGGHGLGAGRVIKAVIFDLDGTLIDSMGVWERIDAEFLAKRGIAVPDGYVDAIATLGAREAAEYTIARFGLPDSADELVSEWNRMAADEYAHKVKLKPYAKEYLSKLRRGGIKLGVATCLHTELRLLVMENNGISSCFDAICNSDDVAAGKDSPDIFLRAAELLETPPENCLVFEDLPRALRSAKRAGMMAYGVLDASSAGQWEELRRVADGTIRDFRDAPTF